MIKQRKKWTKYLSTSGMMYLFCLIFSLFSIVFLSDSLPKAVPVIFGFVFMAPVVIIFFINGKSAGEKDYKERATQQSDKNSNVYKAVVMDYKEIVFYFLGFAVPLIIFLILGAALRNTILHAVNFLVFMPVSLIFNTLGVINTELGVSWISVAVYLPTIIILCGVFVAGYMLTVLKQIRQRREIASELRMFDN